LNTGLVRSLPVENGEESEIAMAERMPRLQERSPGLRNFVSLDETRNFEENNGGGPTLRQMWSAISLVSGTAVGAGILAIASVSLRPGFVPSTITLSGCWVLMVCVGFSIAEITCNIAQSGCGATDFGILSITEHVFGLNSARGIGFAYAVFHYTLLIAYIAEAGSILSSVCQLPDLLGPVVFTLVMGGIIASSSTEVVNMLNNCLFVVVVLTFLGLVCMGVTSVNTSNLAYQNYSVMGPTIPILLISLVFHNIVPTVCSTLQYHRRSICAAITMGSLIPLVMFILWNAIILGVVHDYSTAAHSETLIDPVQILLEASPAHSRTLGRVLVTVFSEAAVITSFIGFVIALMEFFADMFPGRSKKDPWLYLLVLLPPLLIALGNPGIFLNALDAAGAYGITLMFGILPVTLTLKLRYCTDCHTFASLLRLFVVMYIVLRLQKGLCSGPLQF
jgi:tyrosine-specific transport protein